jgi:predicted transcriptional regulator
MKRVKNILQRLGLTENEIEVYLEILKAGRTSHYALAKKTGIPRTTIYDVVLSLENKKLVEVTQNTAQSDIKAFAPTELYSIVQGKLKDYQSVEEDLLEIIPELQGKYSKFEGNSDFQFFEGIDGARKAYFTEGYEISTQERYSITDLNSMNIFGVQDRDNTYPYIVKELIPINEWSQYSLKKWLRDDPDFLSRKVYRYIDDSILKTFTRTSIVGNKVFHSCTSKSEAWGIMVASSSYSDTMKSFFDFAWSKSKKLTADTIRKWPEITMPTGVFDAPSVKIEDGKVAKA